MIVNPWPRIVATLWSWLRSQTPSPLILLRAFYGWERLKISGTNWKSVIIKVTSFASLICKKKLMFYDNVIFLLLNTSLHLRKCDMNLTTLGIFLLAPTLFSVSVIFFPPLRPIVTMIKLFNSSKVLMNNMRWFTRWLCLCNLSLTLTRCLQCWSNKSDNTSLQLNHTSSMINSTNFSLNIEPIILISSLQVMVEVKV